MALRSGLSVTCYTLPASGTPVVAQVDDMVESLAFSTVAPGGFSSCTFRLKLSDAKIPQLPFALFSRVVIRSGLDICFLGEIQDTSLSGSHDQEQMTITAIGIGNALRDSPGSTSYSAKTVQQVVLDQMTTHASYSLLDTDTTQVFPDNPGATYTLSYPNRTFEEVVADAAILAGDYEWGVWEHYLSTQPNTTHVDAAGFPKPQLYVKLRDTSTVHYRASLVLRDVVDYEIVTSSERAYNEVYIEYYDPASSSVPTNATYTDPRIALSTNPFRRRRKAVSFVGTETVTSSQATAIANTYGALYRSPANKIKVTLAKVRDGNSNPIDIWTARAGKNIAVEELAARGTQLASSLTAGTNLFHVVATHYSESQQGWTLELELDNFYDSANVQIARLQLAEDLRRRLGTSVTAQSQSLGAPLYGSFAVSGYAASGGQTITNVIAFPRVMERVPTSITFTTASTSNMTGSPAYSGLTATGFTVTQAATATGQAYSIGTYQTAGN